MADEAEMYELGILLSGLHLKEKISWEQTRMTMYTTVQANSTKHLKPTDIMEFPWDGEELKTSTQVSEDEANRLREKAKKFIKMK